MKRSTFLAIASLIGVVFGLIMGIAPKEVLEPNGLSVSGNEPILARALAACIISASIGTWFARNSVPSSALKGILWIVVLMHLSSLAVDLYYYSQHYLNSMVFGSGALHVVLALGAFYYLMRMEPERTSSTANSVPNPA
jgi:hypothetical protein